MTLKVLLTTFKLPGISVVCYFKSKLMHYMTKDMKHESHHVVVCEPTLIVILG